MCLEECHKPPMTGNGKHTTYKNGDDWGMVYHCFHHINQEVMDLGVSEKWAVDLVTVMNLSGNFPWRKWSVQRAAPS